MIPDANRLILRTLAVMGLISLGFWASPARAQLAPWQRPPESSGPDRAEQPEGAPGLNEVSSPDKSDGSPNPWATEDYEQEGDVLGFKRGYVSDLACASLHNRFWVKGEFLAWWTKGFATPPLLTTSPAGTDPTQVGVLGLGSTSVLLGNQDLQGGFRPGERITFGAWLNGSRTFGLEGTYLHINRQTDTFQSSGASVPILARPFFNTQTGQQDSQIVSYPGQQSGTFSSFAASDFQVAEVLIRKNLQRRPEFTVDFVAGYRYQQLDDHLVLDDALTFSGTQSGFPAGSIVQQSDHFDARNAFHGGEVGLSTSLHHERWTFDTLVKIAVGQTHSRVAIAGATNTTVPGETPTSEPGGLLALPSNMGAFSSNQLSVVPELGVTLGFDLSQQLRATIGYDLVYWNAVARPGDQIDLNLDPQQFPPPVTTNSARPQFILHTSDYWAQGVNLGLDLHF